MKTKKFWISVGIAMAIFLTGYFVGGPWLNNIADAHKPYLIVDPDIKSETGCQYDYLTYIPVEVTGKPPSEGVIFPVSTIPKEYEPYVHYPESWDKPWNPFNPANKLGPMIQLVGKIAIGVVVAAFLIYVAILWRKGKLKKLKDKID